MRGLIFAGALALAGAAQADVVYNWQTIDDNGSTVQIDGQLIVTDDAWRAGAIDYFHLPCSSSPDCIGDPDGPVIGLYFYVDGSKFSWTMHEYREGLGFEDQQPSWVQAEFGPTLSWGYIASGGTHAHMEMSSVGDLWTVFILSTDRFEGREEEGAENPSCWLTACPEITGRWILDQSTVPFQVPLPGTLALLGAGALLMRQRRQTSRT